MIHIGMFGGLGVHERPHEKMQVVLGYHPHWSLRNRLMILLKGILEGRWIGLLILGDRWSTDSSQSSSIILVILSLNRRIWWTDLMIAILEYVAHQSLMFELLSRHTVIVRVFLAFIEASIRRIPPLNIALVRWIECLSVPAMQFSAPSCFNDLFNRGRVVESVVFLFGLLYHWKLMPMLYEMLAWLLLSPVCALRWRHF